MTTEQIVDNMAEYYHKEIGVYTYSMKLDDSNGYYRQKGFNYDENIKYPLTQLINATPFAHQKFEFVKFANKVYFENAWYIEVSVKFINQPT